MDAGDVFGRLTVVSLLPASPTRHSKRATVRCECGCVKVVGRDHLTRGLVVSCGCLARERLGNRRRTHGASGTPEYRSWLSAKNRTTNPRDKNWPRWGGRGIVMAEEWLRDFAAFLAHIGPRPSGTTLDRIDNDGDYAPGNVRWATWTEQAGNRRKARTTRWS